MGETVIRLVVFSQYQGEVFFDLQITDLNALEYRQTAGQNATKKKTCHWGMTNHRLLDSNQQFAIVGRFNQFPKKHCQPGDSK